MQIGIPKEIKNKEIRVSGTPGGALMLLRAGHEVLVQTQAGVGAGFSDEPYGDVRGGSPRAWARE
jgi:alanine dehydrogenase